MLLSALSLAAVLQTAPPVTLKGFRTAPRSIDATQPVDQLSFPRPTAARQANAKTLTAGRKAPVRRFQRTPPAAFAHTPMMDHCHTALQPAGKPDAQQVQPLAKMPKAHGEWAVARLVDGCPVAVLIAQR